MKEEYWLKYGFKDNGDLTCVRTISGSEPTANFFYTEDGRHKEVKSPNVIKITKEIIEKLNSLNGVDEE